MMSAALTYSHASVRFDRLAKDFGSKHVFQSLSGEVQLGEFVSVLGPSGCGKSTLLRVIAGLETPTQGSMEVSEKNLAYVFQDATLLPWARVLENITLPLDLAENPVPKSERITRAEKVLKLVELSGVEKLFPHELSGGMRMRVSIARALMTEPKLLLLDEPFAALDELIRQRLCELLRALWEKTGVTVIFVTHSISEAVYLSNRIVVLSERPARILGSEKVNLPQKRSAELRGEAPFAQETQKFRKLLESGMTTKEYLSK